MSSRRRRTGASHDSLVQDIIKEDQPNLVKRYIGKEIGKNDVILFILLSHESP